MYDKNIVDDDTLVLAFREPVKAISSTVVGGGIRRLTHVVFHRVDKSFNEPGPGYYAKSLLGKLRLPIDSTAVFLTAVDVVGNHIEEEIEEPVRARLIATIGFSPLACIEDSGEKGVATINMLVVLDRALTDNALVDLVSLVASTKTVALVDLALSCGYTGRAYSTVTDALVIASRTGVGDGESYESYGGPATPMGLTVSKLVYDTIIGYGLAERNINERFRDIFGVDIEWIVKTALKIYFKAPVPGVDIADVKKAIERELYGLLDDPNTWALGLAARSLDYHGLAGTIPGLSREEYRGDSKRILADELLGISLSLYINGWKAMFSYYWIDRVKNTLREFEDKPMFIDDIIASLIGSILSRVYDRYLAGKKK